MARAPVFPPPEAEAQWVSVPERSKRSSSSNNRRTAGGTAPDASAGAAGSSFSPAI